MELQIQDLVASIRKEGIDAANAEADSIIEEARKKADAIVADAREEAKRTRESSEKEIGILKKNAEVGLEQAKRDAVLAFKAQVQQEYEKILSARIRKEIDEKELGVLIRAALNGEDVSKYTAETADVSDSLKAELAEEIRNGLEIRPVKDVEAGFRLAAKDGSGYFDCTDEEIMKMLLPFFRDPDF